MPEQVGIGTEFARVLAEPIRLRIVAALGAGPRSVSSLAVELEATEAQIRRHARTLEAMRLVQKREQAGQRVYVLLREPRLEDSDWDQLPLPVKRSFAAAALVQVHAAAAAAVDAGSTRARSTSPEPASRRMPGSTPRG